MTNKTECNYSLSIKLCGDGCKKCQPHTYIFNLENALQAAEQEIEQLRSEIESLKKVPVVSDEQIENIIYQCEGYLNWGAGTQGKQLICKKIREIIGGNT